MRSREWRREGFAFWPPPPIVLSRGRARGNEWRHFWSIPLRPHLSRAGRILIAVRVAIRYEYKCNVQTKIRPPPSRNLFFAEGELQGLFFARELLHCLSSLHDSQFNKEQGEVIDFSASYTLLPCPLFSSFSDFQTNEKSRFLRMRNSLRGKANSL